MPLHACPICGKQFSFKSVECSPEFPFCSRRCRLIDLGRWLKGDYTVPGSEEDDSTEQDAESEEEDNK